MLIAGRADMQARPPSDVHLGGMTGKGSLGIRCSRVSAREGVRGWAGGTSRRQGSADAGVAARVRVCGVANIRLWNVRHAPAVSPVSCCAGRCIRHAVEQHPHPWPETQRDEHKGAPADNHVVPSVSAESGDRPAQRALGKNPVSRVALPWPAGPTTHRRRVPTEDTTLVRCVVKATCWAVASASLAAHACTCQVGVPRSPFAAVLADQIQSPALPRRGWRLLTLGSPFGGSADFSCSRDVRMEMLKISTHPYFRATPKQISPPRDIADSP